ncbi:MAG: DinB family protein [Saprospiraceae bacterium]|nr:DinB family protein [Saprospiraceae bacterium]
MKQLLSEYARYNAWANENFVNLFRSVDETLINQEVVSSFTSIRATLLHIWDAESLWLERLNSKSPTQLPSKNFHGTHEELFSNLIKTSNQFIEFIETRPAPFFRDRLAFKTISPPRDFKESVTDMAHHCLNHSTFHRGQLVMMCRQLNIIPIPSSDYIMYVRQHGLAVRK